MDSDLQIDASRPPFPNRQHVDFLSFALGRLVSPVGARVLEVGSGSGALSVYLALQGARVTGIDVSEQNVRVATWRAAANGVGERADFRVVPIEQLDDADETYDFVVGNQVLHHVELGQAMPNVRRLLHRRGRAVFSEPVLLLPDALRRLRDTRGVKRVLPKRVDTPTERSLSPADLAVMRRTFPGMRAYPFQMLSRIANFVELGDVWIDRLAAIDHWLLQHVPPTRCLCRFLVIELVP
jgi:SAM-dependent methyltransferase